MRLEREMGGGGAEDLKIEVIHVETCMKITEMVVFIVKQQKIEK